MNGADEVPHSFGPVRPAAQGKKAGLHDVCVRRVARELRASGSRSDRAVNDVQARIDRCIGCNPLQVGMVQSWNGSAKLQVPIFRPSANWGVLITPT